MLIINTANFTNKNTNFGKAGDSNLGGSGGGSNLINNNKSLHFKDLKFP